MKRLFFSLAILSALIAGTLGAYQIIEVPEAVARTVVVITGQPPPAGCSPSYGTELLTAANATDDRGGNEADATTDWSQSSLVNFASVADADSVCGNGSEDCSAPNAGTYHIYARVDGSADRMYRDLSAEGLSASTVYAASFYWRHQGDADGDICWSINESLTYPNQVQAYDLGVLTQSDTTYAQQKHYFLYAEGLSSKYLAIGECDSSNVGGFYIDNASISTATLCYGDELYTSANAANIASETDATTGFSSSGLAGTGANVFDSVSTGTPHNGSYHIVADANDTPTNNARFYSDIGTLFSLQAGTKYFMRYWVKHIGTGGNWMCFLAGVNNSVTDKFHEVNIDSTNDSNYAEVGFSFTYSSSAHRYFNCWEVGDNSGGVYIDGISIKEITSE